MNLIFISLSFMFVQNRRMNYTIFDSYKSDPDVNITSSGDINATDYIFCHFYFKYANQAYKSPYCHHVEPFEVALKTVGR